MQRFKAAGVKNAVCFNQEVGNQALTLRCNGFFKGLTDSETGEVLTGNISDPAGMQATIEAALQSDATIDGILTLGPSVAKPALDAVAASGKTIHLATFDLSADVLTAIKDGKMDFAIDQQQFLQGYLPIVILTNYAETKNLPDRQRPGLDHDRPRVRDPGRTPRTSSRSPRRVSADLALARRRHRRMGGTGTGRSLPITSEGTMASTTTDGPASSGIRHDSDSSPSPSASSRARPPGALIIVVFVWVVFAAISLARGQHCVHRASRDAQLPRRRGPGRHRRPRPSLC